MFADGTEVLIFGGPTLNTGRGLATPTASKPFTEWAVMHQESHSHKQEKGERYRHGLTRSNDAGMPLPA